MPSRYCVYVFTHTATGRCYVGKTDDALRRFRQHIAMATGRNKTRWPIHHAIAKYGLKAFTFQVVERFESETESLAAETRWIRAKNSVAPNGFNLNEGGLGGVSPCAETREKLAAKHRGKAKHTPESKARLSAIHTGMKHSPQAREKMRQARAGRGMTEAQLAATKVAWETRRSRPLSEKEVAARQSFVFGNKGRIPGDETRAKMSAAHTGKKFSAETREKIRQARLSESQETRDKRAASIAAVRAAKKAAKQAAEAAERR